MTEEDAILRKFMEKRANEPFVLFVSFVAKTTIERKTAMSGKNMPGRRR